MQHLSYNRTEYFLSGRGGNIAPWLIPTFPFDKVPEGSMKFYGEFVTGWGGFIQMDLTHEGLLAKYIDGVGRIRYETWLKRKTAV